MPFLAVFFPAFPIGFPIVFPTVLPAVEEAAEEAAEEVAEEVASPAMVGRSISPILMGTRTTAGRHAPALPPFLPLLTPLTRRNLIFGGHAWRQAMAAWTGRWDGRDAVRMIDCPGCGRRQKERENGRTGEWKRGRKEEKNRAREEERGKFSEKVSVCVRRCQCEGGSVKATA